MGTIQLARLGRGAGTVGIPGHDLRREPVRNLCQEFPCRGPHCKKFRLSFPMELGGSFVGIICLSTVGANQQNVFKRFIVDSWLVPGSRTDGALKVILWVQATPCTLLYLLEGYPGVMAVKAAASRVSGDLSARGDQKPSPSVVLRDAPFEDALGDAGCERDLDRISPRDHRGSESATSLVGEGGGSFVAPLGKA